MTTEAESLGNNPALTIHSRVHRLRNDIAQSFYDVWRCNDAHPDEKAVDPDPQGGMRRLALALDEFLVEKGR